MELPGAAADMNRGPCGTQLVKCGGDLSVILGRKPERDRPLLQHLAFSVVGCSELVLVVFPAQNFGELVVEIPFPHQGRCSRTSRGPIVGAGMLGFRSPSSLRIGALPAMRNSAIEGDAFMCQVETPARWCDIVGGAVATAQGRGNVGGAAFDGGG